LDPLTIIDRFLRGIKPTGEFGFEGLVALLCAAATKQRFILSGAGSQEGQVSRSESGYGNRIKLEAKHYTKPKLRTRELTSEIAEATSSGSGVDLWILASSCPVKEQQATAIERFANDHSVEVLFLDRGADGLPRLAVLMAAYPDTVESWLKRAKERKTTELLEALHKLQCDPRFSQSWQHLDQKLASTLLGYEDARRVRRRTCHLRGYPRPRRLRHR
jgi:hypothetical protein